MAIKTNTATQYNAVGKREDLSDIIYNITPTDTPFLNGAGRGEANQPLFEWQTDSLSSPDGANAWIEGDDIDSVGYAAATQPTRVANYCQISRKTGIVSGTNEATVKAGRKSEKAYQQAKRSAELKRDMETILLSNQLQVAGNDTTARKTAGLAAWVRTSVDFGATGVNPQAAAPTPVAAAGATAGEGRKDGSTRAFTETILKAVVVSAYNAGAKVDGMKVLLPPTQKQVASGFSGIATRSLQQDSASKTATIAAVDVYVSDFGKLYFVPSRFGRSRDAWFVDFDFVDVAYLRSFRRLDLAKTGDAEKFAMLAEYGLKVKNEGALGLATDLA